MKRVEATTKRVLTVCLTFMLVMGMMFVPAKNVFATSSANESIQNAKNAVIQIMVSIENESGEWVNLIGGTGFLIGTENDAQYVITNDHVANATSSVWRSEEVEEAMKIVSGKDDISKIKTKVRAVVKRDSYYDAEIIQNSAEADLAILKLESPFYNRTPVALDVSGNVESTEKVYALGFPALVQSYQDDKIYTSDDVTVTDGTVSKVATSSAITGSPISYINHSASIADGNSGGPLLNENGAVIGVNDWTANADTTSYYYSIEIKEVTELLDAMGIQYMKAGENATQPAAETTEPQVSSSTVAETSVAEVSEAPVEDDTAKTEELMSQLAALITKEKEVDTSKFTKDSAKQLTDAITAAEDTQKMGSIADEASIQKAIDDLTEADKQLQEKTGPSKLMIGIIIAVVAVILIVVIVIVIVVTSKNKKAKEEADKKKRRAQQQAMAGQGGFQENRAFTPRDTSTMNTDAGDTPTGILNEGSENTTVLSNANMPTATLIRKKTNEKVTIHQPIFKIGKERRKVDYCISDNSNISRSHADIVYRNGKFYIVDNNATNGTSVNGSKVPAGTEKMLTGNDTIRLADEDFMFRY